MLWTVVIAMQGAAGPPDTAPNRRSAPSVRPEVCPDESGGDIVVCGARDQERFRLRSLPPGFERDPGLPRAGMMIGGVGVSAEAEAGQAAGGGAPPRAMVRLKIPL